MTLYSSIQKMYQFFFRRFAQYNTLFTIRYYQRDSEIETLGCREAALQRNFSKNAILVFWQDILKKYEIFIFVRTLTRQ
jgi:hypothetical protein